MAEGDGLCEFDNLVKISFLNIFGQMTSNDQFIVTWLNSIRPDFNLNLTWVQPVTGIRFSDDVIFNS